MNSADDVTTFFKKVEDLISIFDETGDPNPLSSRQKQQLDAWVALLKRDSPGGNSRTSKHVRHNAVNFANKVINIANPETVFLCLLEYSISGLPKIKYRSFYGKLKSWSKQKRFPEALSQEASKLWDKASLSKRVAQSHNMQRDLSSSRNSLLEASPAGTVATPDATPEMGIDNETLSGTAGCRSSSIMYNGIESHKRYSEGEDSMRLSNDRQPIDMAFLVPPAILDDFYRLHKESSISHSHSAILTIPTQDRVASLLLSIPRTEALEVSHKYGLPVIFNSGPP